MSALPLYSQERPEIPRLSWSALALVVLAHVLLFAVLVMTPAPRTPAPLSPMVGILLSDASSGGNQSAGNADAVDTRKKPEKTADKSGTKKAQPETAQKIATAKATNEKAASEGDTGTAGNKTGKSIAGAGKGANGSGGRGTFFSPRVDAAYANNPKPKYPSASRRMSEEGMVTLSVHVLVTGYVNDVQLKKSSGYARLDDAAISAVKKWRYVPARMDETPVACWHIQAVKFSLTD